jgi:ATP-dependent DNA ligase
MSSKSINVTDFRTQIPGTLTGDGAAATTWAFPPVTSTNAHGKTMQWQIIVRLFEGDPADFTRGDVPESDFIPITAEHYSGDLGGVRAWIKVNSGVVGGKIRDTVPTIVSEGKNIGKKNETNVFTQALRDAFGLYNKQAKKAVATPDGDAGGGVISTSTGPSLAQSLPTLYPPMLAQVLKDQKKPPNPTAADPVYVQRKFNGVRTVTTLTAPTADVPPAQAIMYSRRKNLYPGFGYIKAECLRALTAATPGLYFDGEIYAHGVPLQDISGHARREDKSDDTRYKYMIYDCFMPARPEMKFSERFEIVQKLITGFEYLVAVDTYPCATLAECTGWYDKFVAEGYEGAMVRVNTAYEYSYNERHSKVLLKMKPTYDAEFTITGWTTGEKGKAAAALMIICSTDSGKEFPVTPTGEIEVRNALAKKFAEVEANGRTHFENQWKGRPLIVYYDELSKDKLPQRARTDLVIRNEI